MGFLAKAHVTLNPGSQGVADCNQNRKLPNPTSPVLVYTICAQFDRHKVKTSAQTAKKVTKHIQAIR